MDFINALIHIQVYKLRIIHPKKYGLIGNMLVACMKNSKNFKKIRLDGLNSKYIANKIVILMKVLALYAQKVNN